MELDNLTRAQLQAGLQAVLELHQPEDDGLGGLVCSHCEGRWTDDVEYPCPTRQAAENAVTELGGDPDQLE